MPSTLYILRQQPDVIPPSLFRSAEADQEVIFIERASPMSPSSTEGSIVFHENIPAGGPLSTLSYDDLVTKIFSFEHIIVL